ncbi:hypothetical protein H0A71_13695 [Alcaligenaceae bacterium]|nr:hypothetical protein [Alcaligenaceae bacterium]
MSDLMPHLHKTSVPLNPVVGSVAFFPLQGAALAGGLTWLKKGLSYLSDAALCPHEMHHSDFRALAVPANSTQDRRQVESTLLSACRQFVFRFSPTCTPSLCELLSCFSATGGRV